MRALLLLLLCLLPACASFEAGELPHLDGWPLDASSPQVELMATVDGLPDKFDAGWRAALARVVGESERFSPVASRRAGAAFRRVEVAVTHRRQPLWTSRIWMTACALSLGVVPARAQHAFEVRAVVRDASGAELGAVERSVESETWIGWLLLPAMPFAGVGTTGLVEDTFRSVLAEAAARGWL